VDGKEVTLTALELRLIEHLMTCTIDTHVMRLRDKLGPARAYLETVRGMGYRIVEPEMA
jgi:two-component system, OmpR family, phosphate regulon response regulator PhoB